MHTQHHRKIAGLASRPHFSLITAREFADMAHCSTRIARRQLRELLGPGTTLFGAERWPMSEVMAQIRRDLRRQRAQRVPSLRNGGWH